jgi:hypothetical protein
VLYERIGQTFKLLGEWKKLDTMEVAGRVKALWDDHFAERPRTILIDVIGIGAGVVDRLRELGLPVRGINVSEAAAQNDKYRNLRTELWFKGLDFLQQRACSLPRIETLMQDLVGPRYSYTSTGKLAAESKKDMKQRGLKSPNHADAWLLTLAEDQVSIAGDTKSKTSWNQPLKRNRPVIC